MLQPKCEWRLQGQPAAPGLPDRKVLSRVRSRENVVIAESDPELVEERQSLQWRQSHSIPGKKNNLLLKPVTVWFWLSKSGEQALIKMNN